MVAGDRFSHFLLFFYFFIFEHQIFFIAGDNEARSHEKIKFSMRFELIADVLFWALCASDYPITIFSG